MSGCRGRIGGSRYGLFATKSQLGQLCEVIFNNLLIIVAMFEEWSRGMVLRKVHWPCVLDLPRSFLKVSLCVCVGRFLGAKSFRLTASQHPKLNSRSQQPQPFRIFQERFNCRHCGSVFCRRSITPSLPAGGNLTGRRES